jgi:hypothetical protein
MNNAEILSKLKLSVGHLDEIAEYLERPAEPTPQPTRRADWDWLVRAIAKEPDMHDSVKAACLAQAIIETGRGTSNLFLEHYNAHGMKWRDEMQGIAKKVLIKVPSESEEVWFCEFSSEENAVKGYMRFIKRSPYLGWENKLASPSEYLTHIGKTWAADPAYTNKCLAVLPEAIKMLENHGYIPPSQPLRPLPTVDETKNSPNKSERGATISHIILHNTAGSFVGAVSWLCDPASKVSAHLVISRTGRTAQLVPFVAKAWHAGNARYNANSIGIEIEATTSQRGMTPDQEQKVIDWCRYLMHKYEIPAASVLVHRMVGNTTCPVFIWATNDDFYAWRRKNLGA